MDVGEFSRALESLTAEDVHRIAATLTNNHSENAASLFSHGYDHFCWGFAVAQKIVHTSGTILSAFSTLIG